MASQKKKGHVTRKKKKNPQSICATPIQVPVLSSSSSKKTGDDFYTWVNESWLKDTKIPPFENDFGVSEEAERCIFEKSKKIIESPDAPQILKDLSRSCFETNTEPSMNFLKSILQTVNCISNEEDVFAHFAQLAKSGFASIFKLQYNIEPDKTVRLCIDVNSPGLHISHYQDPTIVRHYKEFLHKIETVFEYPGISKIYMLEKNIVTLLNKLWNDTNYKIKGYRLERKFPKIPWKLWFETLGISNWRKKTLYYTSPRWIRAIGKAIHDVPLSYWKLYLAKSYIVNSIPFLQSPYDDLDFEFFGKDLQGQKEKTPRDELLVNVVYDSMKDSFSKTFWEATNPKGLVGEIQHFAKTLVESANHRLTTTEWLKPKTREAAVKKVSAMLIETVRPKVWAPEVHVVLDPKNFLKNIFVLGEMNVNIMLSRIDHPYTFWEEGIYRVNAYYFNENNEMLIPYGTCIEPFYIHGDKSDIAWNYGGLGSIIGHEMCHGFDEEGKDYNEKGEKKRWWTRSDNAAYNHKTKDLIRLYSKQIVEGKHVDGEKTLSENIADLAGLGISLQALKDSINLRGVIDIQDVKEEYKKFFISFATSWRTKYRHAKLKTSLGVDNHSPAFLRVNLVVSQFDEWYEAFDIHSDSKLYISPMNRIRIF